VSPYQPINLNTPSGASVTSRQHFGSPSDSGLSAGARPTRTQLEQQLVDVQYRIGGSNSHGLQQVISDNSSRLIARFIPATGIQYIPSQWNDSPTHTRSTSQSSGLSSPLLPTTGRPIQPKQGLYYSQQMQRRTSDTPMPNLNDLGKGVPLSSVPASWPLYIVEFKAGRTDLFDLTDLMLDITVGELVIVEADRGLKDLGTVVNDTITLKEGGVRA